MPRTALAHTPLPEAATNKGPLVWLLISGRAGDDNQLLALANALGWPFEAKKVAFNRLRHLPFLRKGLRIVARASRPQLTPPWPDLVIAVGYGNVPVARYIREKTGGHAKLIHIGNPRQPLGDFDLQITTPQYSREAPNLIELPLPIGNPAGDARPTPQELAWLEHLPRPRRLIAIGGPARFWELDHGVLLRAIRTLSSRQGSTVVAVSPRTRPSTRRLLNRLAERSNIVVVESFPRFPTLLASSDEIYVTADSVSMLSEAVLSGKPVGMIPIRRSFRGVLGHWFWERATGRPLHPDFARFWDLLNRNRLIGTVELPVASRTCDTVERAADAVRKVMVTGDLVDEGRRERFDPHLGTARRTRGRQQSGDRARRSAGPAVRHKATRV